MPDPVPEISKITLPSGTTYNLKDAQARTDIESIKATISGGVSYIGTTTTEITDGATTNPIKINGQDHTAISGNLVVYGSKEFVFDGTKWLEFGDLGSLGDLAFKDTATTTYTPAGQVSQPTFSGDALTSTGKFTPGGNVTISTGGGTANYTPDGSVSKPDFQGTEATIKPKVTAAGNVSIAVGSGTANYKPAGSVSKPNVTVTPSKTTVNSITGVGTLPTFSATVANENLTLGFEQGTLPTKGADTEVLSGVSAALAAAPTFTGTDVELKATFVGTEVEGSVKYTPQGSVTKPTFSGTGVELTAAFTGTQGNVSVSGTPSGTVSKPTFSGTQADITVS